MKNILLTCFFATLASISSSQVFDVDTIVWLGPGTNRINLVILGDGYQQAELTQFVTDAQAFTAALFFTPPYKEYANYFNVVAIKVPSNESGASHPGTATDVSEPVHPVSVVDNYFGSTFDYAGIHRLLVANNYIKIINVLANNFPTYDIAMILVNSPYYGGSGGQFPVASLDPNSDEVAIHELGHSFGNLIDEYYAGDVYAQEGINMTQETNPELVRWATWIGDGGIGIYQHSGGGNASSWYRPHQNCKMRYLNNPFCAVCRQGTIEEIHSLVSIIDSFSPANGAPLIITEPQDFYVDLVLPIPNTLKVDWALNGIPLAQNVDTVTIDLSALTSGINDIEVMIEDTTQLLRIGDHQAIHFSTITWTIDATISGLANVRQEDFLITLFPNPANGVVSVQLVDEISEPYTVEISDVAGKHLKTIKVTDHATPTQFDISNLTPGVYVLSFRIGNHPVISRKMIKN